MSEATATLLATVCAAYLALGAVFAVPFAWRWAGRLDAVARQGTRGFRLLLLPGSVLLWPYLAYRVATDPGDDA
jgi:hypothetical protein